jgi:hypothetical protein
MLPAVQSAAFAHHSGFLQSTMYCAPSGRPGTTRSIPRNHFSTRGKMNR